MTEATRRSSSQRYPAMLHVWENANEAWISLISDLLLNGKPAKPRGMECLELISYRKTFDMCLPVVTANARELGYKFLPAEAAWILSGDDRVETIAPYSKDIPKFSDDGVRFFGAYGPKIDQQLNYVYETLVKDRDSRQAVINIWRENPPPTKDVPCTLSLQFLIRDGRLNTIATMRSSDAWLGWPYDAFNFTMISAALLLMVDEKYGHPFQDVELGALTIAAGSQHLYVKNHERAMKAISIGGCTPLFHYWPLNYREFETWSNLTEHLWTLAKRGDQTTPFKFLKELYSLGDA